MATMALALGGVGVAGPGARVSGLPGGPGLAIPNIPGIGPPARRRGIMGAIASGGQQQFWFRMQFNVGPK